MDPAKKHPDIRALQSALMGTDVPRSIREDRCVSCRGEAKEFDSEPARREFGISGLCQKCQDRVFGSACRHGVAGGVGCMVCDVDGSVEACMPEAHAEAVAADKRLHPEFWEEE